MERILIKDASGLDCEFRVIRQPSGTQSAILQYIPADTWGLNRTAYPKIEVSTRNQGGSTAPVVTVTVPYGTIVNGNFVKSGQNVVVTKATQPATSPDVARLDAEAFSRNLQQNPQIMALMSTGVI